MEKNVFKGVVEQADIVSNLDEDKSSVFQKRGLSFCFLGDATIGGKEFKIAIGASEQFPNELPSFFLSGYAELVIPHIEVDGFVCYTKDDTVVLDTTNPVGIIQQCFQLATKTIEDGLSGVNHDDFYNEYEAYWRRLNGPVVVFSNISISEEVGIIRYTKTKDKNAFFAASDKTENLGSYERFFNGRAHPPQFLNGLFIPLKPNSRITIPHDKQLLNIEFVRELVLNNITDENATTIRKLLSKTKLDDVVVLALPQPNGYHSLFAIRFKNINYARHPLLSGTGSAQVIPGNVVRLDKEYMIARGGNGKLFISKKVLVVGAGSVGAVICEELVKAAVLNIDVVDKEKLAPENCYRHPCGFAYVMKNKAEAIAGKLHTFYPHANINPIKVSIQKAINTNKIHLSTYDAVIIATGNATTNQQLNRLLRTLIPGKPILYSWLDPYGIGGHCLVTNISSKGCYQCLYTNDDLFNIASFADSSQPKSFVKNISGCGSVYVPYGALDSLQTALLTVRKLLDVFLKRELSSSIFSWKGDSEHFTAEGFKLSPRYFQNDEQREENKYRFFRDKCSVCGT